MQNTKQYYLSGDETTIAIETRQNWMRYSKRKAKALFNELKKVA